MLMLVKRMISDARIIVVVALAAFITLAHVMPVVAQTPADNQTSDVQQLAQKTTSLQQQIDLNNIRIKELGKQEDDLNAKLEQLRVEIEQANNEIQMTSLKIDELDGKLATAQTELAHQKDLLKATFRTLYMQGGASPFELIVGSDSFGTYINDQTYLQKLKDGIQVSAASIVRIKHEIEIQRFAQKDLFKRQDAQRKILVTRQTDQQTLLDQTQGDQEKYKQIVEQLQRQFEAADAQLKELFVRQTFTSLGKVKAGEQIGQMGSSGLSTGPHIHFAIFDAGNYVNPVESEGKLIRGLVWPVPNSKWADISQEFGCTDLNLEPRASWCPDGYTHYGLDIAGWYGDPVVAAGDGDIVFRGDQGNGYGNVVIIDHGNGLYTYYPHLLQ